MQAVETPVADVAPQAEPQKRGPGRPRKITAEAPALPVTPGQVGMNVQYGYSDGRQVAAILTQRNLVNRDDWNLVIIAPGAQTFTPRIGVKYSAVPKAGCWNLIPTEQP